MADEHLKAALDYRHAIYAACMKNEPSISEIVNTLRESIEVQTQRNIDYILFRSSMREK